MGKLFFPSIVVVMGWGLPHCHGFVVLFFLCNELFFHLCPKKGGGEVRANRLLIDE
jgi:hypothetical protein